MLDKPFAASWRLSGRVGLQEALTLPRIAIENVEPVAEGGRLAAKAIVGQPVHGLENHSISKTFATSKPRCTSWVCRRLVDIESRPWIRTDTT